MTAPKTCPCCHQALAANAPDGLCPQCLMHAALPTGVDLGTDTHAGSTPRPFNAPTPDELGPFFPQLEILELLGRGGMGAVYKARQTQLDRLVAVKILPPGTGDDPAFAERFTREAKALAKLNHPNIVILYEFGQTDGLFYFIMEFVDGLNLRQLLDSGRIAPREALAIVPQICDALQYAHDAAIVHRDIKPENILLDRRGRVKVADFGLAKIVAAVCDRRTLSSQEMSSSGVSSTADLTEAGKVMGTPPYMAPEQTEHPSEVDHRADIYSLGVVFYQMLTGEAPGRNFAPPSRKVSIDVRLDEVVLRALEHDPARRYQQVSEVKTMVETIVSSRISLDEPQVGAGNPPDTVSFTNAATGVTRGGGQNARATVARAFCPEPSATNPCANQTGLDIPPEATGAPPFYHRPRSLRDRWPWDATYLSGLTALLAPLPAILAVCLMPLLGTKALLLLLLDLIPLFNVVVYFSILRRVDKLRERVAPDARELAEGLLATRALQTPCLAVLADDRVDLLGVAGQPITIPLGDIEAVTVIRWFNGKRLWWKRGLKIERRSGPAVALALAEPVFLRWQPYLAGKVQQQTPIPPKGAASPSPETPPRFSRTAIVGACWAPLFFIAFFTMFTAHAVPSGQYHGPEWWQSLLMFTLLPLGFAAPFGTTILGCVAVSQIRRSAGKLYGLGLALFDALLFPLLALDFAGIKILLSPVEVLLRPVAQHNETARFLYHDAPLIFFIPAMLAILALDYFLIRRVWRAANKPATDLSDKCADFPPATMPSNIPTPPAPRSNMNGRRVMLTGALMALIGFGAALLLRLVGAGHPGANHAIVFVAHPLAFVGFSVMLVGSLMARSSTKTKAMQTEQEQNHLNPGAGTGNTTLGTSPTPPPMSTPVQPARPSWWPVVLVAGTHLFLLVIAAVFLVFMAARFSPVYSDLGAGLPLTTRWLLDVARFMKSGGFLLLLPLIAVDVLVCWLVQALGGRKPLLVWAVFGVLGCIAAMLFTGAALFLPLSGIAQQVAAPAPVQTTGGSNHPAAPTCQVRVTLDRERMTRLGVTLEDVRAALPLAGLNEGRNLDQVMIKNRDGNTIRLQDIATIRLEEADQGGPLQDNGMVILIPIEKDVMKGPQAPAAATSLKKLLAQLKDGDVRIRVRAVTGLGILGPAAKDAVPVLVDILRQTRQDAKRMRDDSGIHNCTLIALMQIGDAAFPAMKELLGDKDEGLRIDAVAVLGRCAFAFGPSFERILRGIDPRIGPALPQALPFLLGAMHDPSKTVRWWVAIAMANVRPAPVESMGIIAGGLKDESTDVRVQIATTLGGFGPNAAPAVNSLTAGLLDTEDTVRGACQEALIRIGGDASPKLVGMLGEKDRGLLGYVTTTLARIGKPAVVPLAEALKNDDPAVRQAAAGTLGAIGPNAESAAMQLAAAIKDADRSVAFNAIEALGKIGPGAKQAAPALVETLKERGERQICAVEAEKSLLAMGPAAVDSVPNLISLLDYEDEPYKLHGNVDVRLHAMDVLRAIGPAARDAVPALRAVLNCKSIPNNEAASRPVRWHAADALGSIGPAAKETVVDLLTVVKDSHEDSYVRRQAICALAMIAPIDDRVISAMMAALKDKDVSSAAVVGLGVIGPAARDAIPLLEQMVRDAQTDDTRSTIMEVLKKIQARNP